MESSVMESGVAADAAGLVHIGPKDVNQFCNAPLAPVLGSDHEQGLAHAADEYNTLLYNLKNKTYAH